MRGALCGAAIALLGLIVDARPLFAQFVQPPWAVPEQPTQTAPAQNSPRSTNLVRSVKKIKAGKRAIRPATSVHKDQQPHAKPNLRKVAQREGYKRISDLVNFPKFFPGLGVIFVKPDTLPVGPYVCFDRKDRLIATVFMVSIKDIDDHKSFEAPAPRFAGKVDHVTHYFNAGHPGVEMPHYHIVLWHVSRKEEAQATQ